MGKDTESDIQFNSTSTVNVQFKVWAPDFNRVNHRLFLLGSLKQMGAWNINEAVEAFPTGDIHVWKAEVKNLPPKSNFEWVWLQTRSDRTQIKWERSVKRNRTIDNFSGIVHSVYGEGLEVFQQEATCLEVTTFMKVDEGHLMLLTGDSITTGLWNLPHAVKAKEYPRQSGYWKAQVSFQAFSTLNFKWAVIREKDRKLQVMEKQSHSVYGRPSSIRAVAPWNLPRVFIVESGIAADPPDNVSGRTDLIITDRKKRLDEIRKWLNKANTGKTPTLVPLSDVPTPKQTKGHITPTSTDRDLAKSAVLQMSNKAIPVPSRTTNGRKPTVKPVANLDEHSKHRQTILTRTQKLTQQFNLEFRGSGTVADIKGKGQSDSAKESDASLVHIMVDPNILTYVNPKSVASAVNDDVIPGPSTTGFSDKMTRFHDKLSNRPSSDSVDLVMENIRKLEVFFDTIEQTPPTLAERPGIPSIEKDVGSMMTYPPPTWSMLQENEVQKTLNPTLNKVSKKQGRKVQVVKAVPKAKTRSPTSSSAPTPQPSGSGTRFPPSLFDKFKEQAVIAVSSAPKELPPDKSPAIEEPLPIGRDDTMKSASEIMDEEEMRSIWTRTREQRP